MDKNFDIVLNYAISKCEGRYIDNSTNGFHLLYPFTTECISGYIDKFDLKDKSLLTVGSSSDQVFNAILKNCTNIDLIDINCFTKYYYYLKVSCIYTLNLEDYLKFFCYKNYPEVFEDNKYAFNKDIFEIIKPLLRLLDYESYLFWDELFQTYKSLDIRKKLFYFDEDRNIVLKKTNLYLQNEYLYNQLKEKVLKITPTIIRDDLLKTDLDKKYDNIWLSNIGTYHDLKTFKELIDKISQYLNDNGKLLICYLYQTTKDTKYQDIWAPIYNLDETFKIFEEYNIDLISFTGVKGYLFENEKMQDSILIYKKK